MIFTLSHISESHTFLITGVARRDSPYNGASIRVNNIARLMLYSHMYRSISEQDPITLNISTLAGAFILTKYAARVTRSRDVYRGGAVLCCAVLCCTN